MSASHQPRFARLLDLARAQSSDDRRELLREITDVFFTADGGRSDREDALFEDLVQSIAVDLNDDGLVEFAERIADAPSSPRGLVNAFARREPAIAAPILQRSTVLLDGDLVDIVETQGEAHRRAIAARPTVSAPVSDALVERGDDETVNTLLGNAGATIARPTMERVVDRAHTTPLLHKNLVHRSDLPIDLMNEMMFAVEERLRKVILQRNAAADPAEVEAALAKARERLARRRRIDAAEDAAARERIEQLRRRDGLTPANLISLYRARDYCGFVHGFAEITGVDVHVVRGILDRKDIDALALICRAASIERALFVTIAILTCSGDGAMGKAEVYGKLYAEVPMEAAQRAMRFFKVRKATADAAVA